MKRRYPMQPVVSHEVIPETHRNGHQTHATQGLMAGLRSDDDTGYSPGMKRRCPMQPVVSHEVIPETHRNGHQTHATLGLMAGFALMMTLDTALG